MPENAWTSKDERQYEHIRESERERGRPVVRAKEIAARTVNKQRRKEGRVTSRTSRATGNPHSSLEERTVVELRNIARSLGINRRTRMKKSELVGSIRRAR